MHSGWSTSFPKNFAIPYCMVHPQRCSMHFSVFKTFSLVSLHRVPDAAVLSSCLSHYTGYFCVNGSMCYLQTGNYMLQGKIDIDSSLFPGTARTTRSLSTTVVKPRTETGRSSSSNSFCQPCFLCRCTDCFDLTAGKCQVGHLSNFQKATENSPFSLRHVKHSCHRAPLHLL